MPRIGVLTTCKDPGDRHNPLQEGIFECRSDMLLGTPCQIDYKSVATGQIHLHQATT